VACRWRVEVDQQAADNEVGHGKRVNPSVGSDDHTIGALQA